MRKRSGVGLFGESVTKSLKLTRAHAHAYAHALARRANKLLRASEVWLVKPSASPQLSAPLLSGAFCEYFLSS